MSGARVVELDPCADARWDEFALAQPSACGHHVAGWAEILRDCYGFRPRYLALEHADALVGIMPLVYSGRRLSGRRLSSLPTAKSAGPLALERAGEQALLEHASELGRGALASALTVRCEHDQLQGTSVALDGTDCTYRLPASDPDQLLDGYRRTSKNLYRSIRKGEKSQLSIEDTRSAADLRDWYRLYLATIRRHRNFPRRLRQFQASMALLGSTWRLVVVKKHGRVIAGGVFHDIGETVELVYNASDDTFLSERPNHALYWRVLRDAAERGQGFDFGLAASDSLRSFKEQWGAQPIPIYSYAHRTQTSPTEQLTTAGQPSTAGQPPDTARSREPDQAGRAGLRASAIARAKSLGSDALGRMPLTATRVAGALAYRLA